MMSLSRVTPVGGANPSALTSGSAPISNTVRRPDAGPRARHRLRHSTSSTVTTIDRLHHLRTLLEAAFQVDLRDQMAAESWQHRRQGKRTSATWARADAEQDGPLDEGNPPQRVVDERRPRIDIVLRTPVEEARLKRAVATACQAAAIARSRANLMFQKCWWNVRVRRRHRSGTLRGVERPDDFENHASRVRPAHALGGADGEGQDLRRPRRGPIDPRRSTAAARAHRARAEIAFRDAARTRARCRQSAAMTSTAGALVNSGRPHPVGSAACAARAWRPRDRTGAREPAPDASCSASASPASCGMS